MFNKEVKYDVLKPLQVWEVGYFGDRGSLKDEWVKGPTRLKSLFFAPLNSRQVLSQAKWNH